MHNGVRGAANGTSTGSGGGGGGGGGGGVDDDTHQHHDVDVFGDVRRVLPPAAFDDALAAGGGPPLRSVDVARARAAERLTRVGDVLTAVFDDINDDVAVPAPFASLQRLHDRVGSLRVDDAVLNGDHARVGRSARARAAGRVRRSLGRFGGAQSLDSWRQARTRRRSTRLRAPARRPTSTVAARG